MQCRGRGQRVEGRCNIAGCRGGVDVKLRSYGEGCNAGGSSEKEAGGSMFEACRRMAQWDEGDGGDKMSRGGGGGGGGGGVVISARPVRESVVVGWMQRDRLGGGCGRKDRGGMGCQICMPAGVEANNISRGRRVGRQDRNKATEREADARGGGGDWVWVSLVSVWCFFSPPIRIGCSV